jgi:hypothetical protein
MGDSVATTFEEDFLWFISDNSLDNLLRMVS